MTCPGSAHLDLSIPGWVPPDEDPDKGAKGLGHQLHAYLEQTSNLSARDLRCLADAMTYMSELRSRRRFKLAVEETLEAWWLVSKPRTTADVVLHLKDELHIVDYKTGKIPVCAFDNPQLKFYALAYLPMAPKAKGAYLHIVQPWSKEGSNSWFCSREELLAFATETQVAEAKILDGDTSLNPSDHCIFCDANPHKRGDKGHPLCPSMLSMLYPPDELDNEGLLNDRD